MHFLCGALEKLLRLFFLGGVCGSFSSSNGRDEVRGGFEKRTLAPSYQIMGSRVQGLVFPPLGGAVSSAFTLGNRKKKSDRPSPF